MLGSLPKLFDKNFVIGFYLPTLLALIATAWAFPSLAVLDPIRSLATSERKLGDITYIAVIVWVIAVLLMSVNNVQYRVLEGYLPPVSWLFLLRWWNRRRFRKLANQYDQLTCEWAQSGNAFAQEKRDRATKLRGRLVTSYPRDDKEILPTRFGNTIRAFELYPLQAYGADSIPIWPRLASVISKEFAGFLDDARAQVDCFVTSTTLASFIAFASIAASIYDTDWLRLPPSGSQALHGMYTFFRPGGPRHIAIAAAALVVAALAYRRATARALAWGTLVKSAFDCYLPALIKQLGYTLPGDDAERREFWGELNALLLYERPMTAKRWLFANDVEAKPEVTKPPRIQADSIEGAEAQHLGLGPEPDYQPRCRPESGSS
jgi:hypothetical protein